MSKQVDILKLPSLFLFKNAINTSKKIGNYLDILLLLLLCILNWFKNHQNTKIVLFRSESVTRWSNTIPLKIAISRFARSEKEIFLKMNEWNKFYFRYNMPVFVLKYRHVLLFCGHFWHTAHHVVVLPHYWTLWK